MYLCDQCVDEPALQAFISANAVAYRCDYCGRQDTKPIACSFEDFVAALAAGFDIDWENALEFMPNDGDDWALPDAHRDIWDLLESYGFDMHDQLRDDVIRHFDDIS